MALAVRVRFLCVFSGSALRLLFRLMRPHLFDHVEGCPPFQLVGPNGCFRRCCPYWATARLPNCEAFS